MNISEQLEQDFNQAVKNKNNLVVLTLRQLKSSIANAEIAKNRDELTDEERIKLFRTEIKRRKEAIQLYEQGNRLELAEKEKQEIEIISKYLPQDLSEEEIKKAVIEVIGQLGAVNSSEVGKVMGQVMGRLKGMADGNVVKRIISEELAAQG